MLRLQSGRIDDREKAAYLLEVNIKNEFDLKHESIKIEMENLNKSLAYIPGEVDNMVATFAETKIELKKCLEQELHSGLLELKTDELKI
jgi:hypothetical protein